MNGNLAKWLVPITITIIGFFIVRYLDSIDSTQRELKQEMLRYMNEMKQEQRDLRQQQAEIAKECSQRYIELKTSK